MRLRIFAVLLTAVLAGCGAHGSSSSVPAPQLNGAVQPYDQQNGSQMGWKRFTPKGLADTIFRGITSGPDGNIWFTNQAQLIRMKMTGSVHPFNLHFSEGGNTYSFGPLWLGVGADSKFYLGCGNCTDPVNGGGIIGVATTGGSLVIHDIPSGDTTGDNGFGVGPDGNVWFNGRTGIYRIKTTGTISRFAYPSGESMNTGSNPIAGPDGDVWFTEYFQHKVGKINPTTNAITEYDVSSKCSIAQGLAVGTDNKLYFNCSSNSLESITTGGTLGSTPITNPYGSSNEPGDIVKGPNGHIWFATAQSVVYGEYNESTGNLATHSAPFTGGLVLGLTDGMDGNVWGSNNAGFIDVFNLVRLSVSPSSLTFTGTGQTKTITATYTGSSALSATSSNTSVVTVTPGSIRNTWIAQSMATGKGKITVEDSIGNLFTVNFTVN